MFRFSCFIFLLVVQEIEMKTKSLDCQSQRQELFRCLSHLNHEKDEKDLNLIKDALQMDDVEAQSFWLNQWERASRALDKCRMYDQEFDSCASKSDKFPDLTNRTNYLTDKIECIENASESANIVSLKESFVRQIELQCFGTKAPPTERPCQPNKKVKNCIMKEISSKITTDISFNFTINQNNTINETSVSSSVEQFYKLFDVSKTQQNNFWECYECLQVASEECRPSKKQRACILKQKKPIVKVYKRNLKKCMELKGYKDLTDDNIDEFEILSNLKKPFESDFCYAVSEEIYIR